MIRRDSYLDLTIVSRRLGHRFKSGVSSLGLAGKRESDPVNRFTITVDVSKNRSGDENVALG
jgi:hypothetical protein